MSSTTAPPKTHPFASRPQPIAPPLPPGRCLLARPLLP
ncbi:MAG: hypothetical protein [Olavius algarvensis Gamma 1 endosymbiont]|nr:MAG: hypothetical protein [Olavius algarvensis Gamma 1 endosymbiont]